MKKILLILALLPFLLFLSSQKADAATVSWDGGGDGLHWSDPLNWSTDTLPASTDDIIISGYGTEAHLDIDFTVAGTLTSADNDDFVVDSGKTLTINAGGTLSINRGPSGVGSILVVGTVNNYGTVNDAGSEFRIGGVVNNNAGAVLNNIGGYIAVSGVLNNNAGGTINNNFDSTHGFAEIENLGELNNGGTINNDARSVISNELGIIHNDCGGIINNSGIISGNPIDNAPCLDTIPPDTAVNSAIDGNSVPLVNGGTTLSNSITFAFTGSDNVGVSGFQCSLDGTTFASCSSTKSYSGLSVGSHAFQVRAVDTSGNTDPTPAIFNWTILSPSQATKNLINLANGFGVQTSSLGEVSKLLSDSNPANDKASCGKLGAFVSQVNLKVGKVLTKQQADQLIHQANTIKSSIGC